MKIKKGIAIVVVILAAIGAVVYYRYFANGATPAIGGNSALPAKKELNVSAIATYKTPKGEDKVRFTLTLDGQGAIIGVRSSNVLKNDEVTENLAKFSNGLLLAIKGKKLSELQNVDKVGTASLTTDAFNGALGELKSQI